MIPIKIFMTQTIKYIFRFQFVELTSDNCSTKIYDWKCDYVKNKIVSSINLNDTTNMNKTIEKIRTGLINFYHYHTRFSEHNGKIYLHIIRRQRKGPEKFKYYMIEPKNDSYVIRHGYDCVDSTFLMYALHYGFPDDYLECAEEYIKSDKIINSVLIYPSSVMYSFIGKINENKYCVIDRNELQIYTVNSSFDVSTSIVNLNDFVYSTDILKNKLYMILANHSLCIYDTETGLIENEYSHDRNTIIEKYGQVLIFKSKYHAKYKIFSLKPEIKNVKTFDLSFHFQ